MDNRGEAMIRLDKVNMMYPNGTVALHNCSLDIGKGEFAFIVGSSGSGKSTLIKTLLGEVSATSGYVEVAGKDLSLLTRKR